MRSLFLFLTFLLFLAWVSFARFYYVCEIKNQCADIIENTDRERPKTLDLKYQDSTILESYEQFGFGKEKITPFLTDNNESFLDKLAEYLNLNEDRQLKIHGFYRESEQKLKHGFFENLGLARAASIRERLMDRGVEENRIFLDFNRIKGEDLIEPVTFTLLDIENDEEDLVTELFSFYNMTFSDANFEVDSDIFTPGEQFISYADSVKTYFDINPDNTLTIIGHTDSDGSDDYNDDLGLRRAQSAQTYFNDLGITSTINVESKGKRSPMAPNNTIENKQKNRRVNFRIE